MKRFFRQIWLFGYQEYPRTVFLIGLISLLLLILTLVPIHFLLDRDAKKSLSESIQRSADLYRNQVSQLVSWGAKIENSLIDSNVTDEKSLISAIFTLKTLPYIDSIHLIHQSSGQIRYSTNINLKGEKAWFYSEIVSANQSSPDPQSFVTGFILKNDTIAPDYMHLFMGSLITLENNRYFLAYEILSSSTPEFIRYGQYGKRDNVYMVNHEGHIINNQQRKSSDSLIKDNRLVLINEKICRERKAIFSEDKYISYDGQRVWGHWVWLPEIRSCLVLELTSREIWLRIARINMIISAFFLIIVGVMLSMLVYAVWQNIIKKRRLLHVLQKNIQGYLRINYPAKKIPKIAHKIYQRKEFQGFELKTYCFFQIGTISNSIRHQGTCPRLVSNMVANCNECPVRFQIVHNEISEIGIHISYFTRTVSRIFLQTEKLISHLLIQSDQLNKKSLKMVEWSREQSTAIQTVSGAMEDLTDSVNNVASAAIRQSQSAVDIRTRVGVFAKEAKKAFEKSQVIRERSQRIFDEANAGGKVIKQSVQSMDNIRDHTQKVIDIINVITDISDQVNLLSLNAAIEAARAGDQGRGFAVVADAISALADKTASSAKNIVTLINEEKKEVEAGSTIIHNLANSFDKIISALTDIRDFIGEQTRFAGLASESGESIANEIDLLNKLSFDVTEATTKQKETDQEIAVVIDLLNERTQDTILWSHDIKEYTEMVHNQSQALLSLISFYTEKSTIK